MQEHTAVLRQLGVEDVMAWGRSIRGRISTVKRVIHLYTVSETTLQMTCVNCGLNIINTKFGEGTREAGKSIDHESEKCCG